MSASAARPSRLRSAAPVLLAATVVAVALAWDARPPIHGDTAVDVALARDCVASRFGACAGHASSADGISQGQLFTRGLAAWMAAGLPSDRAIGVAVVLDAAAAFVLAAALAARTRGLGAAWAVVGVIGAAAIASHPTLWNPTWVVAPATLLVVALAHVARTGSPRLAPLVGVLLALAAEGHVVLVSLAPLAAALVAVVAEAPAVAGAGVVSAFVATALVASPEVTFANASALIDRAERAPWAVAALVVAAAAAVAIARPHIRSRSAHAREALVVAVWLAGASLGVARIVPWLEGRAPALHYATAAPPAAAWLAAVVTPALPLAGWTAAAALVASWLLLRSALPSPSVWSAGDVVPLARATDLVGAPAADIARRVRAVAGRSLATHLIAEVGRVAPPTRGPARTVWRAIPAAPRGAQPGGQRVRLPFHAAWLDEIVPWSHPEVARICPSEADGDGCATVDEAAWDGLLDRGPGVLHRLLGGGMPLARRVFDDARARGTEPTWRIPLSAAGQDRSDGARVLVLDAFDASTARFVAVVGARFDGRLPARCVRVDRPLGEAWVVVRAGAQEIADAAAPPMLIELLDDERAALAAVERATGAPCALPDPPREP